MSAESNAGTLELGERRVCYQPQGAVRVLARSSIAAWVLTFVTAFVLSAIFRSGTPPRWVPMVFGGFALVSVFLFSLATIGQLWSWLAPFLSRTTTVTPDAITTKNMLWTRTVTRDSIDGGWVQHSARGTLVVLRTRLGDKLSVDVDSRSTAEQVLDTLGVHPDNRALEMPLGTALRSILGAVVSFLPASCAASFIAINLERILKLPSPSAGFLLFALLSLFMIAIAKVRAAPVVEVGADGVAVRTTFSKYFLPFSKLKGASVGTHTIDLALADGTNRPISAMTDPALLQTVADRINEGVARAQAPRDLSARLGLLDRAGREFSVWLEQLRALAVGREDYRGIALSREELAQVLDDSLAPAERRIGAAYVLAQMDKGAVAERVRVVVEKSANDAVSRALERAADGTLDEEVYIEATREGVRVG
ncbi:MAG: hypothetical protein JNK05_41445 [Myxococcales bacterium]|nr:hypothetical protein [Myxococcales bacterium]